MNKEILVTVYRSISIRKMEKKMKNILVCSLVVALCSVGFAGGELPGPRSYNPAPVYQPQYVVPAPAVPTTPVVVERRGIFNSIGGYVRNRAFDIGDVVCQTFDAVVGVVTLDPARDDEY